MHLPHVTARDDRDLGLALRWSYGSAFGLLHGVLRRTVGEPWASAAFGGTLMTATLTLFPLLGHTPPPWRWPADVMATSLGTHVAYVAAVAAVDDGLRRADALTGAPQGVLVVFPAVSSPAGLNGLRRAARVEGHVRGDGDVGGGGGVVTVVVCLHRGRLRRSRSAWWRSSCPSRPWR